MNTRLRRVLAAPAVAAMLGTAFALAAPSATAADTGSGSATDGILSGTDGTAVRSIDPATGKTADITPGSRGTRLAWAADGSRYALVDTKGTAIVVGRHDGKREKTISKPFDAKTVGHPAFDGVGNVVFASGGRLQYAPADGVRDADPLIPEREDGCDSAPSGAFGLVAFVRTGSDCGHTGTPAVWTYDRDSDTLTRIVTDATQPAFSPDGSRIAFVRTVDGHQQIFTADADGSNAAQLTPASEPWNHAHPAWEPGGDRIAYDGYTSDGRHKTVVLDPATGKQVTAVDVQQPAWQPLRRNLVGQVYGSDFRGTNVGASRWTWNAVGGSVPGLMDAKSAVLVSDSSPWMGLTATSLAAKKQGPVLMTGKTGLNAGVRDELQRILPKGATVYLVGGAGDLGSEVAGGISALGYTPERISGSSRYVASVNVAKAITSDPDTVFVATGKDYHSALAANAAAGAMGGDSHGVVLLTDNSTMTASVVAYLNAIDPTHVDVVAVGESARTAIQHANLTHWPDGPYFWSVTGATHEETAANLARFWWGTPPAAGVAHRNSWQGGTTAATSITQFGPLLWTEKDSLSNDTWGYLVDESAAVRNVAVFGGSASVSDATIGGIGYAISNTGNYDIARYRDGLPPTAARSLAARPTAPKPSAGAGHPGVHPGG